MTAKPPPSTGGPSFEESLAVGLLVEDEQFELSDHTPRPSARDIWAKLRRFGIEISLAEASRFSRDFRDLGWEGILSGSSASAAIARPVAAADDVPMEELRRQGSRSFEGGGTVEWRLSAVDASEVLVRVHPGPGVSYAHAVDVTWMLVAVYGANFFCLEFPDPGDGVFEEYFPRDQPAVAALCDHDFLLMFSRVQRSGPSNGK
ncbi:MAG: hypothetical protein GKS00_24695 [Alphaproteobacteria bacterium]|nr:hypothetical protein [Alphaproteobacteria bacterium]